MNDTLDAASLCLATLGMLVYQEPDEALVKNLVSQRPFTEIPFAGDTPSVCEGLAYLEAWTDGVAKQSTSEGAAALNREWLRLLVGFGEPAAPPWAAYYLEKDPVIFGATTLAVRQCYARYGLEIERKYQEPDDHLGLMLSFCAQLAIRQHEALCAGDQDEAARLSAEQTDFLARYLLPWLPQWVQLVADKANGTFYHGLALLIEGTIVAYYHMIRTFK